ncbi:PWWP domain-containing DNA repair factor 3A [Apus apus]|uniref:PWWP domain-containing DNA repair factor 3A n=1 Tax=Apus apus TaxID=8895 RepID=UPI0021F8B5E9|nr:PWWP domain-containing DNA repair factor 3A [Apus apus]XP_051495375.1 PWWP domain-containing DNA repair factor 3A [Apus apus]
MTEQEFVLCMWQERLWPAKVLCKAGATGKKSVPETKEGSLKVEILGLKEQASVSCAGAVPLEKSLIENIAATLDQRDHSRRAVEELKYCRSLRIALDILSQNGSAGQVPPAEGANPPLSQENKAGSVSSTPSRRSQQLPQPKEKLGSEASRGKRGQKNNLSLKSDGKRQKEKGSFLSKNTKGHTGGANLSRGGAGALSAASNLRHQTSKLPESKSLPREKQSKSSLLAKCKPGNKIPPKPKEGRSKQKGKKPRGAGPGVLGGNGFPEDPAGILAEGGSALPTPCGPDPAAPARGAPTRSLPRRTQPGRKLPGSSCESASGDLEKGLSTETEGVGEQLDGGEQPRCLKQVNGEQESGAGVSSERKRNSRNCPPSSSGPSNLGACSESVPAQPEEEENKSLSPVVLSKVKQFQLPDFEEDEGLEPSALSSEVVSSESLSRLSPLVEEEEEEEELPSILSLQEPQSIEEGILVWCKMGRFPYWPAVVKTVRRKHRRACVLLIEGDASTKKKGFSVSLKNLKHFDCEEKQDLIERAREGYRQEIEWCIRLISDYRIRVGCHSFTGSFLEYFAADISYPVRKEGYQGPAQVTFPSAAEEDHKEPPEASPQKPSKKLLPDRTRAARDRANQKIVEFIVKTKGAEEHLLAILKSRKQSRWLKEFLNSRHYVTCIETYLEDEEQLELVVNYLKEVYREMDTKGLHQIKGDGIKFISDVLLPEAIIYAISAVDDIDYKKAEEKYIKGPSVSKREREIFDEEILGRKKQKIKPEAASST